MIVGLRGMFENQARAERFNTSKSLFACRLIEGSLVSPHVIEMIGYIERLEKLGFPLSPELATDVILQSLPTSFEPFILNFHMNSMEKSITEFHVMLKTTEKSVKKSSSHVMMVQKDSKKRKPKAKAKALDKILSSKPKPVGNSKANPAASDACHHYHKPDHWRRN